MPIAYLPGPMLFFYVRNELKGSIILKKTDLFHFIPFVICLISILPYCFLGFEYKLNMAKALAEDLSLIIIKNNISWLYPSYINFLVRPFILFGYALASLIMVKQFLAKRKLKFSLKNSEIIVKWLVFISTLILLIGLLFSLFTLTFLFNNEDFRTGVFASTFLRLLGYILLAIIPILMLAFPEVLYNVKKRKKEAIIALKENHKDMISVANAILNFMNEEKNILNTTLKLSDICSEFELNRSEINYCFSMILKTTFTLLRKEIRVNYAKKLLETTNLEIYSLEHVWMKAGFTSRTTFFVAFKQITGLSPLEYLTGLKSN
jgi:AraC-like DNA-binding protein